MNYWNGRIDDSTDLFEGWEDIQSNLFDDELPDNPNPYTIIEIESLPFDSQEWKKIFTAYALALGEETSRLVDILEANKYEDSEVVPPFDCYSYLNAALDLVRGRIQERLVLEMIGNIPDQGELGVPPF
jgi:hypothetical protein